jgi:D-3-phosphoglycerate dehydrogenase
MKVLLLDTVHHALPGGLRDMGFEVLEAYTATGDALQQLLAVADGIIIRSRFPVNENILQAAPKLKFIGRVGAGMENIEVAAAEARGVQLFNAPEGNRNAVGEHALGMLLMLFNNLRRADAQVRAGKWLREANRGIELEGKTVGIIGYGYMGSAFAGKLRGFDVEVLAYDKYKTGFGNDQVQEVSLETLQVKADVLSIHLPQTDETRFMVNQAFIAAFAKPFYLINTARGKIVETDALVKALEQKKVLGACLDVLEYEKSSFEHMFGKVGEQAPDLPEAFRYLLEAENVLLSPHIAGWTVESNRKMAEVLLNKIEDWKDGTSV